MSAADCPLMPREREAVLLAMRGLSEGAIAAAMGISQSTVRTHLKHARDRLDLVGQGRGPLFAVMLDRGWVTPYEVAPEDAYQTWLRASQRSFAWVPSAAQRCYLNAFGRLLWRRDVPSAYAVHLAFALLCVEAGVRGPRPEFDPTRALARLDDMLLRLGRGLSRPLYDDLPAAA